MKKVRYLIEQPGATGPRWYWQPSTKLRALGWQTRRLHVNSPAEAEAAAETINAQLDQARRVPLEQSRLAQPSARANSHSVADIVQRKSKRPLVAAELRMWAPQTGGCVYVLGTPAGLQKIGLSREPEQRRLALMHATGQELQIWLVIAGALVTAKAVEAEAHKILSRYRRKGEWFSVSPERAVHTVLRAVATLTSAPEHTANNGAEIFKDAALEDLQKCEDTNDLHVTP